jgi:hypothetical protein
MEYSNLCPLNRAYNQFFEGKKGCFTHYGNGKATLHPGLLEAARDYVAFFGVERDHIGLENPISGTVIQNNQLHAVAPPNAHWA